MMLFEQVRRKQLILNTRDHSTIADKVFLRYWQLISSFIQLKKPYIQ